MQDPARRGAWHLPSDTTPRVSASMSSTCSCYRSLGPCRLWICLGHQCKRVAEPMRSVLNAVKSEQVGVLLPMMMLLQVVYFMQHTESMQSTGVCTSLGSE